MFRMPTTFKTKISLLLMLVLLFSVTLNGQQVKIKIMQTTDDHGAIYPYDFTDQKEIRNSLAQAYTYIKKERANENQETILLNGGDILQGTPAVYYYNYENTKETHLLAQVMNFMKFDAGAVGNHDIETGHPVYDRFNREIKFDWLAANAINSKTKNPYFKPYSIIERKGIKIAVLGLITPHIPNWLPEKIWEGIEWEDMIVSAQKWVEIINEKEKPNLLIGLFHAGVDYTYGNQTEITLKNENASKLVAKQVPGFDVVFVGHDHRGWNFKENNVDGDSVLILGGTSGARDLSVANCILNYDPVKKVWNKRITGEIVETKNISADDEFMNRFSNQFEEVKNYVTKNIGTFTEELNSRESIFGSSAFNDFVNQVQLELTSADISFTAPLSLNSTIDKGDITVGEMFKLYKYENLLYTMKLSGSEVKNYLEHSCALWFNQMKSEDDHLLNFQLDEKGNLLYEKRNNSALLKNPFYNFDAALGINYEVDITKEAGNRVKIISMQDGSNFAENKMYKVAVNSYRGNGGGGHLITGAKIPKEELAERIINSTDKDLRYYLMKWIEKNKIITPKNAGNWKVVPEEFWNAGMKTDYKILFGK